MSTNFNIPNNTFPFDLTSPGPDQRPGKVPAESFTGGQSLPDRTPPAVPEIGRKSPVFPAKPKMPPKKKTQ
jgi:hypothetical protein